MTRPQEVAVPGQEIVQYVIPCKTTNCRFHTLVSWVFMMQLNWKLLSKFNQPSITKIWFILLLHLMSTYFLLLTANPASLPCQRHQGHFPDHRRLLQRRGPPAGGGRSEGTRRGDLHPGHLAGQHQGAARHGIAAQRPALLLCAQLCRVWGARSSCTARR